MFNTKNFIRKVNQIRNQNWSAPAKMTAFIIFCMFMVHSFEAIGILNKDRNMDFRLTTPEKSNFKFFSFLKNNKKLF